MTVIPHRYKVYAIATVAFGCSLAVDAQEITRGGERMVVPHQDAHEHGDAPVQRRTVVNAANAESLSYSWELLSPLGLHEPATIDTLLYNYGQRSVPTAQSIAYATTGNLGAAGLDMIYFDRAPRSDFFFRDALRAWLPMQGNHIFYNTRIPMTLLSYNTAGGRENKQDRLHGIFSGNVNERLQFGAMVDYLYSKGCYQYQANKNLSWGFSSSYIGDRYKYQTFFNHYNGLYQNNGGITDDLYITDPAQLQGGETSIDSKSIPTNLTASRTRLKGQEFYMNHRYKMGFWQETVPPDTVDIDTVYRSFVPVTSLIWTLDYNSAKHIFYNGSPEEAATFWDNNYLTTGKSEAPTSYWSLRNTFGVSLLEGFHKYAKAGLAAFVTHEIRRYKLCADTIPISGPDRPEILTPYPYAEKIAGKTTQNLIWVGAQLTKQNGRLLIYDATARIGLVGDASGELDVKGKIGFHFPLLGDTVRVSAYGQFSNTSAPFLLTNYVSNHFIWHEDFGKTRTFKVGGYLNLPRTNTFITAGMENIQNLIYFGPSALPVQHGGSVQVINVSLNQNFKFGILNWNNRITWQTSSESAVLPLPKLALYTNLFIHFKVAKVLTVDLGIDCDYYTKYYAPNYQPATSAFYTQDQVKVGNYPFMNLYANMKLKRARFYIMMSHINQGLTGKNYFSLPHYPMNPRRFQMGVSVDFAN